MYWFTNVWYYGITIVNFNANTKSNQELYSHNSVTLSDDLNLSLYKQVFTLLTEASVVNINTFTLASQLSSLVSYQFPWNKWCNIISNCAYLWNKHFWKQVQVLPSIIWWALLRLSLYGQKRNSKNSFFLNIFFSVPQEKEIRRGLEQPFWLQHF